MKFEIGKRTFDCSEHTYVMGILNATPDSFSDGGEHYEVEAAVNHAGRMIAEGADIIDVGGESTRPGHVQISDEEEISRVVPVIEAIRAKYDIPISIDTYKSRVAKAALDAGADMVNDIWGLKYDPDMAGLIAERKCACCLMQNRNAADYNDLISDIIDDLSECIDIALRAGIKREKIMLDPGVGFGKTYEDNLMVIKELERFNSLGYPVLLGSSRKSVIGNTLGLGEKERVEGTLVTTVQAVNCNTAFIRVHDVKENVRAIQMASAIKYIGVK